MSVASSAGQEATDQSSVSGSMSEFHSDNDSNNESEYDEPEAKRARADDDPLSVEHNGQPYYVGDHVELEDPENSSGTQGTELAAIAQIHKLLLGGQQLVVMWYVYPQLTPHPAYMEFYPDALLRTFRLTTVPVSRIRRKCFVMPAADAVEGRPREWQEGERLYVCESRFVDKGGFIQKIKRGRGFWPEAMSDERMDAVARPVPWADGPRELEKAPVPVNGEADDTPTRRSARLAATPATPATPATAPAAATPMSTSQMMAFQQMLAQQQQQPPPPFMLPGMTSSPAMAQLQKQMAGTVPGMYPAVSGAPVMPIVPPRRRGRPPKNQKLIEKRAKEDAAVAVAMAQQQQQLQQLQQQQQQHQQQATPRRLPSYMGRPPPSPAFSAMSSAATAHSMALATPQMHARAGPTTAPVSTPQPPKPQPPKLVAIPYAGSDAEPQLPKEVVEMFPSVNGRIKWFAAAPMCQPPTAHVRHSQAYLEWKQQTDSPV
ncbi:hypothetical protein H4S02_003931 [Coemansia sp. RSA 2611]|nr:hypothetical protein LPJ70_004565 [Coemansia sp. RSA 2708]KAJ2386292.1 hypothetical protein H4S02_003931 [Coemansia sp. RSA 2611]